MNDSAVSIERLKSITIDLDFEGVCPPLSADEFVLLEQNILSDGEVTNPLIVWNNSLVDGHHRRQVILKHPELPLPPRTVRNHPMLPSRSSVQSLSSLIRVRISPVNRNFPTSLI